MTDTATPELSLRQRQIELEQDCITLGVARYEAALEKATAREEASDTRPAIALIRRMIDPTALLIEEFVAAALTGKAGRKHVTLPYFCAAVEAGCDAEQIALLTARAAINGAALSKPLQHVALNVATSVEDHMDLVRLAKQQPGLFRRVSEQQKKTNNARHRTNAFRHAVAKYAPRAGTWGDKDKVQFGIKALELLRDATDLIQIRTMTVGSHDTPLMVLFNEEWAAYLENGHEQLANLSPLHLPMIHPPKDWTNPYSGGYLTTLLKPRFVRTSSRDYLSELGGLDLSRAYRSVNAVQSTAWQINAEVYAVLREMKTAGYVSPAYPTMYDEPLPKVPAGIPEGVKVKDLPLDLQEDMKAWKIKAAKIHGENADRKAARVAYAQKTYIAERFLNEPVIYFPHNLDFRGRVYPMASFLHPQGDDASKGLLRFAEGKPLGARGAYWLKVHIANLFGVDKVPFDERVAWTEAHSAQLEDAGRNPIDGERFWETADKGDNAVCALAACFEWVGYLEQGDAFVSRIPIHMDGSCSGLQHFSALLRDPEGGAQVNLVPQERPGDIYTAVSKKAQALSDVSTDGYSSVWRGKFCRSVAKQPTMTLCYAATMLGMANMIAKALNELDKQEDGSYLPLEEGQDNHRAALFAAKMIWEALADVVKAARNAMDWLQKVARLTAKANLPLRWTTPMGLPVMQAYRKQEGRVVAIFVGGKQMKVTLNFDTSDINGRGQASAIAPNYVHSLDGAHLMRTAMLLQEQGIKALAVIHDSFGTHAADTDALHEAIREAFIQQYTPNRLAEFREEVIAQLQHVAPELLEELPELPATYDLDIEAVRGSLYLFA